MFFDTNSIVTVLSVTAMTAVMVMILPWLDRRICSRLGISLDDSISANPDADRLLQIRKFLLILMFILYLAAVGYVTLFSRNSAEEYRVQAALYQNLASSFQIDLGILGFLNIILQYGFREAFSHVQIHNPSFIAQVYLNICMFIPLGYLLPYIFDRFRRVPVRRTVTVCFLGSLFIENVQLITKLGWYDVDDIFSNTIGGWLGVILFMAVAYRLTHPDWRRRLKKYRIWKQTGHTKALYPFFRKLDISRATVIGSDPAAVREFYGRKLGMYLSGTVRDGEGGTGGLLYEFGRNQLEVLFTSSPDEVNTEQHITIACNNSERLKKRLDSHGIATGSYETDPYTGLRTFRFSGPDNTVITIIEE